MSELTRRYARALYLVSPDEAALRETAGALMGDAALWEALISPAVEPAEKVRVLERLPFLSGPLLRFCCLLAEKGRMVLLPEILEAFHDEVLAGRDCARCVVTCAHGLEAGELDKLRRALCRLHHKKDIQFDLRVDPELLGGFTLDIEGVTYDKSVRGALRRLEQQLKERRMA